MKKKETSTKTTSKTVQQLEEALGQVITTPVSIGDFDVMRFGLPIVMLFGETLRSIKEDNSIAGNKIELGLKKSSLTSELKGHLLALGWTVTKNYIKKKHNGVSIEIKLVSKKYRYFDNPDIVFYKEFESVHIPNPWKSYYKVRGFIK